MSIIVRKVPLALLMCMSLGFSVSTLGVANKTSAVAQSLSAVPIQKIRIAVPAISLLASMTIIAIDGGFLLANGIDAELLTTGSGPNSLAAVASGSAQVYGSDPGSVFAIQAKQPMLMPIRVYSGAAVSLTLSNEAVTKTRLTQSSPLVERVKALQGFTIASVGVGSSTTLVLRDAAKSVGVTVKETYMQTESFIAALQQGRIDGFVGAPPFGERATADGFGAIWINGPRGEWQGQYGLGYIQQSMGFTEDFVTKNPELAARIVKGFLDASDMIAKEPDKAGAILRRRFPTLDDPTWKTIWPAQARNISEPIADLADMQAVYEGYAGTVVSTGGKPTVIDLKKMLAVELVAKARALSAPARSVDK